jgi:hypothetical protein
MMKMPKETDYAISILHFNYTESGEQTTGGLLKPGDRITINGKVPTNAKEFSINFCYSEDNCVFPENSDSPSDSTVEEAHPINKKAKCL